MARRERYWVCRKCPAVYTRLKGEDFRACYRHGEMVAARTYPYALMERGRKRNQRQQEKREQVRKPHLRVRHMRTGRLLTVSPAARIAFQRMERTGTRKTFQREAEGFLEAIANDFFTCHHGVRWPDKCSECAESSRIRSYGGTHGLPKVVVSDSINGEGSWTLGIFRRALLQGVYEIGVKWEGRDSIPQMSETMLHEVIHWMDSYWSHNRKGVGLTDHDKWFHARLDDLKSKVKVRVNRRRKR